MTRLRNQELVAVLEGYEALNARFNEFLSALHKTVSTIDELRGITLDHDEGDNQAVLNFLGKKFRIFFDILNREHRYLGILEAELTERDERTADLVYKVYFDSQGTAFHTFDGTEIAEDLSDERFVWRVLYRISRGYFDVMRQRIGFVQKE